MKLFIWEGHGISDAYHDDGTLVVLAHDTDEARQIMRDMRANQKRIKLEWDIKRDEIIARIGSAGWINTPEGEEHWAKYPPSGESYWDGTDESINREPDRVVELDEPKWVAFNGGGYD